MSLSDDLRANADVAFAFAGALEQELGDDALLTVGQVQSSILDVLHDDQVRAVSVSFTAGEGNDGIAAIVALQHFADTLERAASDEILLTSTGPALEAATHALATLVSMDVEADAPRELDLASLTDELVDEQLIVYPILEGTDVVACLVIAFTHAAAGGASANRAPAVAAAAAAPQAPSASPGPLVLADVEMGVTAELGRCRLTVRELLSLTPGAVIDLDRAAGALVDVLVNGTLIARGEVVVIDEEFGIRIAALVKAPAQ